MVDPIDEGGEAPCFAHLLDDELAPSTPAAEPPPLAAGAPEDRRAVVRSPATERRPG
jgi:hypothetical protein